MTKLFKAKDVRGKVKENLDRKAKMLRYPSFEFYYIELQLSEEALSEVVALLNDELEQLLGLDTIRDDHDKEEKDNRNSH